MPQDESNSTGSEGFDGGESSQSDAIDTSTDTGSDAGDDAGQFQDDAGDQTTQTDDSGDAGQDAGQAGPDGESLSDYLGGQVDRSAGSRQTTDASMGARPNSQPQQVSQRQAGPDYNKLVDDFGTAFGEEAKPVVKALTSEIERLSQQVKQLSGQQQNVNAVARQTVEQQINAAFDKSGHAHLYGQSWQQASKEQRQNRAQDAQMAQMIFIQAKRNGKPISDERAIQMAQNLRVANQDKPQAVKQVETQVRKAANRNSPVPNGKAAPAAPSGRAAAIAGIQAFLDGRNT